MNPILTHEWSWNGLCGRCGDDLTIAANADKPTTLMLGTPVGKIVSEYGGTRVYVIGERDSNQKCEANK